MTEEERRKGRMFLQIGDTAIAIEHIVSVYFGENKVSIELDVQDGDNPALLLFEGDDHEAFMGWWEYKADVWKAEE